MTPTEATADNLTDEQIRDYDATHHAAAHRGVVLAATSGIPSLARLGRQRIADAINARAKAGER